MVITDDEVMTYSGPFARIPRPMTARSICAFIDDVLRKAAQIEEVTRRGEVDLKGLGASQTYTLAH